MLAAERGASANTLAAYRRDLMDFRETVGRRGDRHGAADVRAYLGGLTARGLAANSQARRLSALRQFFRFLVAEGHRADDPTATAERPKPRRASAEGSFASPMSTGCCEAAREQAAATDAHSVPAPRRAPGLCPARTPLRDGPARFRAGRPAGIGRPRRAALHLGSRQGRARAAGSAQRRRPGGARRLSRGARDARQAGRQVAVSRRQRQRTPHPPGIRARPEERRGRRRPRSAASSRRTCCGTPSPRISCPAAPIFAWCRRFSAMPTSPRRRSIRTCSTSG